MKKILIYISVCSFILLLVSQFCEISQWQMGSLLNMGSVLRSENRLLEKSLTFSGTLFKDSADTQAFLETCEENNIALFNSQLTSRDFYYTTYEYYLFLPEQMKSEILTLSGVGNVFGKDSEASASTLPNEEQIPIDLLDGFLNSAVDDQITMNAIQLLFGQESQEVQLRLLADSEQSVAHLMEQYADFMIVQDDSTIETIQIELPMAEEVLSQCWRSPFLLLYALVILLVNTAGLSQRKKEISIHKLNGVNVWKTYTRVFLRDMSGFALTVPVLLGILAAATGTIYGLQNIQGFYLQSFLPFLTVHVLVLLMAVAEGLLWIRFSRLSLKGASHQLSENLILALSLGCLCCTGILMIPFAGALSDTLHDLGNLRVLIREKERLTGYIIDNFWDVEKSADSGLTDVEIILKWNAFLEQQGGIYENFELAQMETIPELKEMGMPLAEVNKNYLKDYTIHLSDGTLLDLSQYPEGIPVFLVPESRQKEAQENDLLRTYIQTGVRVDIQNGIELVPHLVTKSNLSLIPWKDLVIAVVPMPVRFGESSHFLKNEGEATENAINNFLKENRVEGALHYSLNTVNYQYIEQNVLFSLIQNVVLTLIYLLCLGMMIRSLLQIYLLSEQKLIAIRYHLGASFSKKYHFWILFGLMMNLCIILIFVLRKTSPALFVPGWLTWLLLFVLVTWRTISKFEKGRMVRVLKGEESL